MFTATETRHATALELVAPPELAGLLTQSAELLLACPVELAIDLKALISRPGVRVQCDSCGEEIINQREVVRGATTLCRACADEGAYLRPRE